MNAPLSGLGRRRLDSIAWNIAGPPGRCAVPPTCIVSIVRHLATRRYHHLHTVDRRFDPAVSPDHTPLDLHRQISMSKVSAKPRSVDQRGREDRARAFITLTKAFDCNDLADGPDLRRSLPAAHLTRPERPIPRPFLSEFVSLSSEFSVQSPKISLSAIHSYNGERAARL